MAKTTKTYVKPVADRIQFQRTPVTDLTITGRTALADVSKKDGEIILELKTDNTKADNTKVYTKEEIDNLLQDTTATPVDTYTKEEIDNLITDGSTQEKTISTLLIEANDNNYYFKTALDGYPYFTDEIINDYTVTSILYDKDIEKEKNNTILVIYSDNSAGHSKFETINYDDILRYMELSNSNYYYYEINNKYGSRISSIGIVFNHKIINEQHGLSIGYINSALTN